MKTVLDILLLAAVPTGFITMIIYFVNLRNFGKELSDQLPEQWERLKSDNALQPFTQLSYLALKETGSGTFKSAALPQDLMILRRSTVIQIKISIVCFLIIVLALFLAP